MEATAFKHKPPLLVVSGDMTRSCFDIILPSEHIVNLGEIIGPLNHGF